MTEVTSAVLGVPGSVRRILGYLVCHEARVGSRLGLPFILFTSGKLLTFSVSVSSAVHWGHWATDLSGPLILMCF